MTPRRKKFVEELANPHNKTIAEAGKKAGYSDKTSRSNVYILANNPHITQAVQKRKEHALAHYQVSPEEVLGSAVRQMRGSIDDVLDENGYFSIEKARETGAVDFLKKHKRTIRRQSNEQGFTETETIEVEMLTNQDGRKEVANYIGLEKFATPPSQQSPAEEQAVQILLEMLKEGYDRRKVIKGLCKEYDIDAEVLECVKVESV